MIRTMLRINMGVLALFVFLWGNISAPFAFGELVKDPLKASVSQPQQERAELYVLTIDINGDGLNDALIGENLDKPGYDKKVVPDWEIYLKVQGGYQKTFHTVRFNREYIAWEIQKQVEQELSLSLKPSKEMPWRMK